MKKSKRKIEKEQLDKIGELIGEENINKMGETIEDISKDMNKYMVNEFKKAPLKRKVHYICCFILGVILSPFYYAYKGLKKIIEKVKKWKNKQN